MGKSILNRKFCRLFAANTIGMLVEYIVLLSDNIIAGNIIGEKGLAAITLVSPFFTLTVFLTYSITLGSVICMTRQVGKMNRKRANEFFSNGLLFCFIGGGLLFLAALLFKDVFLSLMNVSAETYDYASSYFAGILPLPLLFPIYNLCYESIVNEGDEQLATISSVVQIVSNIGFSILLCHVFGIIGIGIGTSISVFLALFVCSLHFFKKSNEIRFRLRISLKDFLKSFRYSFNDASMYLYISIFTIAANLLISNQYGEAALVVFSIVMNVQSLIIAGLDGVGTSASPLINIFLGEGNLAGIKKVLKTAFQYAIASGAAITFIILLAAPYITKALGVSDTQIADQAVFAIRILGVSAVFLAVFQLYSSYCMISGKLLAAIYLNTLEYLILQLLMVFSLQKIFGLNGMWIGLAGTPVLALLIGAATMKCRYKTQFPLFFDKEEVPLWRHFEADSTPKSFMGMVSQIETFLQEKEVPRKACIKTILLAEEACRFIKESNPQKVVLLSCSVRVSAKISLIFRDDGKSADFTNQDNEVTSLQMYLSSSLIENYSSRTYLRATSFNRSIFHVENNQ